MSKSQIEMWQRYCQDAKGLISNEPREDALVSTSDQSSTGDESDSDNDSDSCSDSDIEASEIGDTQLSSRQNRRQSLEQTARAARAAQIYLDWQDNLGRTGRGSRVPSTSYEDEERKALVEELMKRAGEMCMQSLIGSQARRSKLRYPNGLARGCSVLAAPAPGEAAPVRDQVARRRAVTAEARHFNERYAGVQEVMQGRLTFRPPVRSNTAAVGEVARAVSLGPLAQY